MDLIIAIARIMPRAKYRLSSSVPPHSIVEWRDARQQPSEAELSAAWVSYLEESRITEIQRSTAINDVTNRGVRARMYDADKKEYSTVHILLEEE
jgi:hypothetical protein